MGGGSCVVVAVVGGVDGSCDEAGAGPYARSGYRKAVHRHTGAILLSCRRAGEHSPGYRIWNLRSKR